jgi:hypothetical protein
VELLAFIALQLYDPRSSIVASLITNSALGTPLCSWSNMRSRLLLYVSLPEEKENINVNYGIQFSWRSPSLYISLSGAHTCTAATLDVSYILGNHNSLHSHMVGDSLQFPTNHNMDQDHRVPGYRSRGSGFDSRRYQIFWEVVGLGCGPFSLVSTIEELLGRNSSGSGPESRDHGSGYLLRWSCDTLYPQKLALTSPTSNGSSQTRAIEFSLI